MARSVDRRRISPFPVIHVVSVSDSFTLIGSKSAILQGVQLIMFSVSEMSLAKPE
jgi:hypothetical protein